MLLSKSLDKVVDAEIKAIGAPGALTGVLIAMIVFTPEGISALKAASRNQLQRTVNLCLGACLSHARPDAARGADDRADHGRDR